METGGGPSDDLEPDAAEDKAQESAVEAVQAIKQRLGIASPGNAETIDEPAPDSESGMPPMPDDGFEISEDATSEHPVIDPAEAPMAGGIPVAGAVSEPTLPMVSTPADPPADFVPDPTDVDLTDVDLTDVDSTDADLTDVDLTDVESFDADPLDDGTIRSAPIGAAGETIVSSLPDPDESSFFDEADSEMSAPAMPETREEALPNLDNPAEPTRPIIAAPVAGGPIDAGMPEADGEATAINEIPTESSVFDTQAMSQGELPGGPGEQSLLGDEAFGYAQPDLDQTAYEQTGFDQPAEQAFGYEQQPAEELPAEQAFGYEEQAYEQAQPQFVPEQADVTQVNPIPVSPAPRVAHNHGAPVQPILVPAAQPRSPEKKAGKAGVLTALFAPLLAFGAMLLTWWLLTRGSNPVLSESELATPSATLDAFRDLSSDQSFWDSILLTLVRIGIALGGGVVGGLVLGWLTGRYTLVRNLYRPVVAFFRLASPILLLPFFFLWFGIGGVTVWLPALIGMIAMVTWTMTNAIDDQQRRLAFNIGERVILALRTGLAVAWPLLFAAEMIGAEDGIGSQLFTQRNFFRVDRMIVWLFAAVVLTVAVDLLLRLVQYLLARRARRELV